MDWSFRDNWDEFAWEKEIRKDELRIACYFKALPGCLDLPGEDDMIFNRLMSHPELVPTGVSNPRQMTLFDFEQSSEEEADDDNDENTPVVRQGRFFGLRRLERMAMQWNMLVASKLPERYFPQALGVTCNFGKLLSRIANFTDVEDEPQTRSLRISLCKRMLADLNELGQALEEFKKLNALKTSLFERLEEGLTYFRESMLDIMQRLREEPREK